MVMGMRRIGLRSGCLCGKDDTGGESQTEPDCIF